MWVEIGEEVHRTVKMAIEKGEAREGLGRKQRGTQMKGATPEKLSIPESL
jgi:hypothetical protein